MTEGVLTVYRTVDWLVPINDTLVIRFMSDGSTAAMNVEDTIEDTDPNQAGCRRIGVQHAIAQRTSGEAELVEEENCVPQRLKYDPH